MTVTVIGGSGFLGTSVCKILEKNRVKFHILDLKISEAYRTRTTLVDIRNLEKLRAIKLGDIVIHLAAIHRDDTPNLDDYYSVNVTGTRNITEVMSHQGAKKLIFTSSVAVYGINAQDAREDTTPKPVNDYGKSKLQAEHVISKWLETDIERTATIIRPTVIFGIGNRGNVFNLIRQIKSRFFVMIGDGKNKKSMAYVENIAEFIVQAVFKNSEYSLINYADKPDYSMASLTHDIRIALGHHDRVSLCIPLRLALAIGHGIDQMARVLRKKLPISRVRIEKFATESTFSADRAFEDYKPKFSLKEGLEKTIREDICKNGGAETVFYTE
jgi:nucleoside-diphosphate-sugar epimerase